MEKNNTYKYKRNIIKKIIFLTILLSIYIFISAYSYVSAVSNGLSSGVFRLHIIANSDTKEDQELKYLVRDKLIEYMNSLCLNCKSKKEVIFLTKEHISDFKQIAEKTIQEKGFSYPVNIEIGNFEFPSKSYGDISFPSGYYDALKVKIGESSGQNWWCVMFPPLCFINPTTGIVSEESKEILKENLTKEEFSIVSDSNISSFTIKFKIIEFFKNAGLITAKNN